MPKTWLPDPSHYPEQMTPLSATVWFEAVGTGLHEAMREIQGPFAGFHARTELGWAYEGEYELEWEPDPDRRRAAALELRERWRREYERRVHDITDAIHCLRPEVPPRDEAVGLLDRMWELVLEQWTIHFLAVVPAQFAIQLFVDAVSRAFEDGDAMRAYRVLDGLPNESTDADEHLWRLSQRAEELGVADVLREYPAALVVERLRELGNGRRFLHDLDAYLLRFGGRSRWHELSLPREAEQPEMTVESIRLFLQGGSSPSLAMREESDRLERELSSSDSVSPELIAAGKFGYGLKESHVYHIDYPGLLATREVLLGFGRRLLAEGRLRELDDVWMLTRGELRDAVGDTSGSWNRSGIAELVDERREELVRGLKEGPKPFLGEPPAEGERDVVLETFYGTGGGKVVGRTLRGEAASPGRAEGPARVVAGPEDFRRVRPGDVLVATTTTPAWTPLFPSLAALVTDTGGVLSHAAIVAREYGLPAVVGAGQATRLIRDGATVRVDGATGEVELLG